MIVPAILTVLGSDRPGLTSSVAEAVAGVGGTWLESHFARLRGVYVGSVLVEFPQERIHELQRALGKIEEKGLRVDLLEVGPAHEEKCTGMALEVVGQDRPGIVHEVTAALSSAGVNIASFESRIESSSWSGIPLFRAVAELTVKAGTSEDALREALESVSGDLMVDLGPAPRKEATGPTEPPVNHALISERQPT